MITSYQLKSTTSEISIFSNMVMHAKIAEWLAFRTSKQEGPGLNPGGGKEV